MSPRLRRVRAALPALLLAVPLAAAVAPRDGSALDPAPVVASAAEDEAYKLFREEKLLTARTRAQEILDADPRSVVGHFVLGSVLREAEGSLPRSMAHLREARRLLALSPDAQKRWPRLTGDILWSLTRTAAAMERFEEQLDLIDAYELERSHKIPALRVWPLLKLRRFDEARAYAMEALAEGGKGQELTALNGLCVIEDESHRYREAYDACQRTYEAAKTRKDKSSFSVYAHNDALAALGMLRFEEAEALSLAGGRDLQPSNSNPWNLLALLYTGAGRADDTVAALREVRRWVAVQPPHNRDQKSAETDAVIAIVLLAAGEPAAGLRFIDRAVDRPDRRAIISSSPDQARGGHALLRRALLRLDAEVRAERAAARGAGARAVGLAESLARRAAAWPDEEQAIAVLTDEERLVSTVRPYGHGSLEPCPPWLAGDLVGVLGPGVVAAALARARAVETVPEAAPFYDAFDAEIAFTRGDDALAQRTASAALDALPRAEALLRARVAALGAEAARRRGDTGTSLGLFERALALDPGVLRRLGFALPARVEAAGGPDAERAAAALRRSPRLRGAPAAFVVRVEGDARALSACLLTPAAAKLSCAEAAAAPGDAPGDLAARLADELHRAAFAMRFSLTPTDLRSLDGSTTMAQGSAREALRGLLDEGGRKAP